MKKIFTFLLLSAISSVVSGQAFWTENFGTGCNQGQVADGAGTFNGTWKVTQTGNATEANVWYLSAKEDGTGTGNCSNNNCANSNQSIHVSSNDGISTNDAACNYNAGGLCGLLFCVTTNSRVESPVINCTGKTGITLTFNYIENGDGSNDNGTCWYYNGSTWAQLADMPKTTGCTIGKWTSYSVSLPASANNNPNVKVGFLWTNDDNGVGTDPSLAVDDIQLSVISVGPPPVPAFTASSTLICADSCISFSDQSTGTPTSWLWTFTGATPPSSTMQSPPFVCYMDSGTFSVKLKVSNSGGSDSLTFTNYIHVKPAPLTPTITQKGDSLLCSTDPSYTSYQWFENSTQINGANGPILVITHGGNYNIRVTNEAGCATAVGIQVGINDYFLDNKLILFPNPARDILEVKGNSLYGNCMIGIINELGEKISSYERTMREGRDEVINVRNLSDGIYFIQISNDRGRWTGRFVKE